MFGGRCVTLLHCQILLPIQSGFETLRCRAFEKDAGQEGDQFGMSTSASSQTSVTISLADESLVLMSQRAVWWADRTTAFVADLHFGKEATFRSAAIPVPDQTQRTLQQLSALIAETAMKRLVILGDLIHSRRGRCERTFAMITDWRARHSDLDIDLVRGNHDQSSGDPPAAWRMTCVSEPFSMAPFLLCHHPEAGDCNAAMAGHLHPMVRLSGAGRDSAKLACFLLRNGILHLPAFSPFVDGAVIRPMQGDKIYGICEDRVLPLL